MAKGQLRSNKEKKKPKQVKSKVVAPESPFAPAAPGTFPANPEKIKTDKGKK